MGVIHTQCRARSWHTGQSPESNLSPPQFLLGLYLGKLWTGCRVDATVLEAGINTLVNGTCLFFRTEVLKCRARGWRDGLAVKRAVNPQHACYVANNLL